jgi:CRP-like cAMP-binding protein
MIRNARSKKFDRCTNRRSNSDGGMSMCFQRGNLQGNDLLGALPVNERQSLEPHLQHVRLTFRQVLADAGEAIKYVYFPTTAVLSMLHLLGDGATVEVAAIGAEGLAGVSALMGGAPMPTRVEVRSEGYAYAIDAQLFKQEFDRGGFIRRLMLLYIHALMTQIAQRALCNRHHSVNEQLCGWLLLTQDRLKSNDLPVTHQLIANMLGVRRGGVTEAAGNLQQAGLISCRRGHIIVIDRVELLRRTCACYSTVKKEFERLLPGPSFKLGAATEATGTMGRSKEHHFARSTC